MRHIFVFGSNLAGRHGAGAALAARKYHGAKYGQGAGRQGNSYAIPTKNKFLFPLPLAEIRGYCRAFIAYARMHPELEFDVTAIGCGLAGYRPEEIAPGFIGAPENVHLPKEFIDALLVYR